MSPATAYLTATELLRLYGSRELSPVEVARNALDRIEATDAEVNAFCLVDADGALAQARESEARWAAGKPTGLLDGVPVALKDLFMARGWPTLRGSWTVDEADSWDDDAPVTAALRRHGATLLGKTTMPELGWKAVTDSPRHGVTRNPWDPTRTAGGSTGGTAVAVALGITPLGPGTDGGGSIRVPSAFCGLVGLKPTGGLVPVWPASPFHPLGHAGPMARTVEDTALLLDVLAVPDPRDPFTLPAARHEHRAGLDGSLEGLRVAYSPDLGYARVDPEVGAACAAAARRFEELGAAVEEVTPGFPDPTPAWSTLWSAGAAQALRHLSAEQREAVDPGLVAIAAEGARLTALDYLDAMRARADLGVGMGRFHARYDLLLTPTAPVPAFGAGRDVPEGWPDPRWQTWVPFSLPFNLTRQPAATVPCGFTQAGLPIGLQVVGPRHADGLVLRAAHAYEQADPLHERHPPEP